MSFSIPTSVFWWLLGVIAGICWSYIFYHYKNRRSSIAGIIEVDIQSNLCKFHVTTTELSDLKTKKAMFKVVHNVDLSRDEQLL